MNVADTATRPANSPTQEERTWATIAHLSALAGLVLPFAGAALGPLVVWLTKRELSTFVENQAREALNFNITVLIAAAVCVVLTQILIGLLLGLFLGIFWLVMTAVAATRANEGVEYRYPLALRLVK